MNKEIYTIIGVGVTLAALLITSQSGLRADMRDEHSAIRAEMREAHLAIRAEIADVRSEMRNGQAALRTELADVRAELVDIRTDIGRLGERVARIEVRLDIPADEPATAGQ